MNHTYGLSRPAHGYINASIGLVCSCRGVGKYRKIFDLHLAKEKIGRPLVASILVIATGIFLWSGSTYLLVIRMQWTGIQ